MTKEQQSIIELIESGQKQNVHLAAMQLPNIEKTIDALSIKKALWRGCEKDINVEFDYKNCKYTLDVQYYFLDKLVLWVSLVYNYWIDPFITVSEVTRLTEDDPWMVDSYLGDVRCNNIFWDDIDQFTTKTTHDDVEKYYQSNIEKAQNKLIYTWIDILKQYRS